MSGQGGRLLSLLLNWRIWAALALAGLLAFTHLTAYRHGKQNERSTWLASVAAANAESLRLERARQSRVDESVRTATVREAGLRASAARAGDAVQRLRDALTAQQLAGESAAAATKRANTYGQLLGESAAALTAMAATCDRHVNDVQTLLDAWPQ